MLAAALLLAIAACGGGNSSAEGSGTATSSAGADAGSEITKSELITRGDAICRRTDTKQQRLLKAYTRKHPKWEATAKGQEKAISQAGLPPVRTEVKELARLGAPENDSKKVDAIVDAFEAALAKAEEDPGTALEADNPFVAAGKLAAAYGFKDCSQPL